MVHLSAQGGLISISRSRLMTTSWFPTEWESDGRGEITVVGQCLKTKHRLHLVDGSRIATFEDLVDLVDDSIDTGNAVLRAELLDGIVPRHLSHESALLPSRTYHWT